MGAIVAIMVEPGDPELPIRLERMLTRSPYRGDAKRHIENGVGLGIQSIDNDASLAHSGDLIVAIHGFIGNWPEISRSHHIDLRDLQSDAERLAESYRHLGKDLFGILRGEFSAVVFVRRNRQLLIARDLIGQRPLFFSLQSGEEIFIGTEIGQIFAGSGQSARLDDRMLAIRVASLDQPVNRSFFRGVSRFKPGSIYIINPRVPGFDVQVEAHWNPPESGTFDSTSINESAERLRPRLVSAINRAIPGGERSFGLALSGGIDSSAIWGLLHNDCADLGFDPMRCRAYSMVFPGRPEDESTLIRANLDHVGRTATLIDLADSKICDVKSEIPGIANAPYRLGSLHLTALRESLSSDGLNILFTGFGGDEWFRGNLGYLPRLAATGRLHTATFDLVEYLLTGRSRAVLWREGVRPWLGRFVPPSAKRLRIGGIELVVPELRDQVFDLIAKSRSTDYAQGAQELNHHLMNTIELLQSGVYEDAWDQITALGGVSRRQPLMDRDLIDFSLATNPRWMIKAGETKFLFRRAVHDVIPKGVSARRSQTAFDRALEDDGTAIATSEPLERWQLVKRQVLDEESVDKTIQRAKIGDTMARKRLALLFDVEAFARGVG